MKLISSFKKLVSKYDHFLFDQWGVLHNGSRKFPLAEECLSYLKKKNKCVILVSNSSRPTKFSIKNLDKLGISNNLYDYCFKVYPEYKEKFNYIYLNQSINKLIKKNIKVVKKSD